MKLHILQAIKNHGPPPSISFKPDPSIGKKPNEKVDSMRFKIKTHTVNIDSKIVSLYLMIFNTMSAKANLKFLILLKKILKGHNLKTGPHK